MSEEETQGNGEQLCHFELPSSRMASKGGVTMAGIKAWAIRKEASIRGGLSGTSEEKCFGAGKAKLLGTSSASRRGKKIPTGK